jgi:hypothetical protein
MSFFVFADLRVEFWKFSQVGFLLFLKKSLFSHEKPFFRLATYIHTKYKWDSTEVKNHSSRTNQKSYERTLQYESG